MIKGKKPRTGIQVEADDKKITGMALKRMPQRAIGQEMGMSQTEVGRSLRRVRAEWKKQANQNYDAQIAEKEAMIWGVINKASDAYDRSIGEARTVTTKSRGDGDLGGDKLQIGALETTEKIEELNGDPRYLTIIENCIRDLRDLKGLDAPKRSEISGLDGGPIPFRWANPGDAKPKENET